MTKMDKIIAVACVVILILGTVLFAYYKSDEAAEEDLSEPGDVLEATNAFLTSGKSTMITAEALYANLNDGYTGNDPYILSVRSEAQYAVGHIPGAYNIPWTSVFTEENISKLRNMVKGVTLK